MVRSDLNIKQDSLTNTLWESVGERLVASRIQQAQQANKRRRSSPQYQLDSLVKIQSSAFSRGSLFNKLQPIFLSPYPLIKFFLESDTYSINTPLAPSGQIRVHTSFLAPWFPKPDYQFSSRAPPKPGPGMKIAEDSDEDRYDVERIIKAQACNHYQQSTEFLITWKCYDAEHNTCQPEEDIQGEMIV